MTEKNEEPLKRNRSTGKQYIITIEDKSGYGRAIENGQRKSLHFIKDHSHS